MYIMFPIGFMYYFGVNLDSRFAVPDFWPKKGETNEIPFEKEEIAQELERLKQRRLAARARRLAFENETKGAAAEGDQFTYKPSSEVNVLEAIRREEQGKAQKPGNKGWRSWFG